MLQLTESLSSISPQAPHRVIKRFHRVYRSRVEPSSNRVSKDIHTGTLQPPQCVILTAWSPPTM